VRCKTLLLLVCLIAMERVLLSYKVDDRSGSPDPKESPLYGGSTVPYIAALVLFPENIGGKGYHSWRGSKGDRRTILSWQKQSSPAKDVIHNALGAPR
jgi:hypothetical protein